MNGTKGLVKDFALFSSDYLSSATTIQSKTLGENKSPTFFFQIYVQRLRALFEFQQRSMFYSNRCNVRKKNHLFLYCNFQFIHDSLISTAYYVYDYFTEKRDHLLLFVLQFPINSQRIIDIHCTTMYTITLLKKEITSFCTAISNSYRMIDIYFTEKRDHFLSTSHIYTITLLHIYFDTKFIHIQYTFI